jgi:hypothetical protein
MAVHFSSYLVCLSLFDKYQCVYGAAIRAKSEAIVLSGSVYIDMNKLLLPIEDLVKKVNLPVFIGGKASSNYFDDIVRTGAIPLGDDITHSIKRIISELDPARD